MENENTIPEHLLKYESGVYTSKVLWMWVMYVEGIGDLPDNTITECAIDWYNNYCN